MRRLLCLLILSPTLAWAQGITYTLSPPAWSNVITTSGMYNLQMQNLSDNYRKSAAPKSPVAIAPVSFVADRSVDAAAKLSKSYPENQRPKVLAVFRDLLDKYHAVERQFSIPQGDLAGAVTMFLVGSYEAYHGKELETEAVGPLLKQMRVVVRDTPAIVASPDRDKQEMYEQMAILGMFLSATQLALEDSPNPQVRARLKQAGKDYLENFLKVDVERIVIDGRGMSYRP